MCEPKLIVAVLPKYERGWLLPRFRTCMTRPTEGILVIRDELVPDWNRQSRVARLQDARTGAALAIQPLFDAQLAKATPEEWTLTGIERIDEACRAIEYAQRWAITPLRIAETRS